jgi:hypothetical protein
MWRENESGGVINGEEKYQRWHVKNGGGGSVK